MTAVLVEAPERQHVGATGDNNHLHSPSAARPAGTAGRRRARYPTNGVGDLAYREQSKAATAQPDTSRDSDAHRRARELLQYTTTVAAQANIDLYHLRMLNQWRQQSPFVSRTSELAAGFLDQKSGSDELPLFLPTNQYLERACLDFHDALEALTAATLHPDAAGANELTNKAVAKLRVAAGTWRKQRQRMDDYQRRTGLGNELVQESVKVAYMTIVAATTGFTAGWAFGVGSGTLKSLAATAGVTAAATGTATGALTAAEQLHAGTFDPGAIARSALEETARTLAMAMVAGGLTRAFASVLSPMLYSFLRYQNLGVQTQKALSVMAIEAVDHGAFVGSVIAVLAGGGAAAVMASVQAVLQAHAGRPLTDIEFSKLVVDQLVIAGVYQLAVAIALRRTNSRFVDLRDKPIDEVLAGQHAPPKDQWGLYEVKGPDRTVSVLALPSRLDHNWAIHAESVVTKEVKAIHDALHNPVSAHGYLANSLVIHTHGGGTRLAPGNQSVADLTARVLALKASQGDRRCRDVLLNACYQADGIGRAQVSNAQRFQIDLHQTLRARDYDAALPSVYTGHKPGVSYAGHYSEHAPRLASKGGLYGPMTTEEIRQRVEAKQFNQVVMFWLVFIVGSALLFNRELWRAAFEAIGIAGPDATGADRDPVVEATAINP